MIYLYFRVISYCVLICILPTKVRSSNAETFVSAAIDQTKTEIVYDPSYFKIPYPNGDLPKNRGVCTDVIIRAYRKINIDLQILVHKDMSKNWDLYPSIWGLKKTDTNIDHRRVPNLQVFFKHKGINLPISKNPRDYKRGDIVTWNLKKKGMLPHIGIVGDSSPKDPTVPLIIHNIGYGVQYEDILFSFEITGHYRYFPDEKIRS